MKLNKFVLLLICLLQISSNAQDRDWSSAKWSESSLPFKSVREEIDRGFVAESVRVPEIEKFKKNYLRLRQAKSPERYIQGFSWLYASYRNCYLKAWHWDQNLTESWQQVVGDTMPSTYEYIRLLFLIDSRRGTRPGLKSLAKRLVAKDGTDWPVKARYTSMLNISDTKERELAIKYCSELIEARPAYAPYYSKIGFVYFQIWLITKDRQNGEKSIWGYRRYLDLAPQTASFRPHAIAYIREIEKKMK